MSDEHEELDFGPNGPVVAARAWLVSIRDEGIADNAEELTGIETWPTLSHRRVLEGGDEVVVFVRPDRPIVAIPETGWQRAGFSLNVRMRKTEGRWHVIGFIPGLVE